MFVHQLLVYSTIRLLKFYYSSGNKSHNSLEDPNHSTVVHSTQFCHLHPCSKLYKCPAGPGFFQFTGLPHLPMYDANRPTKPGIN